jgi:peptidase inhibitor family I36
MVSTPTLSKRAAVASGAALAAGAAAVAFLPATSDAAISGCPANALCMWHDDSFKGCGWQRGNGTPNVLDYRKVHWPCNPSVSINDEVSSVWNNTDRWVRFYADVGGPYQKHMLCIPPGAAHQDLEALHLSGSPPFTYDGWGDDISGHTWEGTTQPGGCSEVAPNTQGCSF